MKIGFDAKRAIANFSGLGNYSRFIIDILQKGEPDSRYFLFYPKKKKNIRFSELLRRPGTIGIVPSGLWQKFPSLWRLWGIDRSISETGIEIFHGLSNELPLGISKTGVKTVVTIHDLIFLRYPDYYHFIDRKIYNLKFSYACRIADKIIAISECTKKDIIHFYGIEAEKIEVVYQGCDKSFSIVKSEQEKKAISEKYGLPSTYVLSVGTIEERKNLMLIIKALELLPENIHLVAVGKSTPYAEKIKKYIARKDIAKRIHFYHQISFDELPSFYQMASVFVYPSFFEGFGIPIVEALRSGIPVIGAKGSCLEEAGGPSSIYVDPLNEKELADAINNILTNKTQAQEMIKNGKEYAKRFDDNIIVQQLANIYHGLLKK